MIDLYFAPTPNGWKVSIMLAECGLEYTLHPVELSRGEQSRADFLAISPNGRIPAIVDHGVAGVAGALPIFESGAILLHLAEKTGRFLPPDARRRSVALQWLFWQVAGLGPMLGQHGHFKLYAREKIPYAIERYAAEARRLYQVLDLQLGRTQGFIAETYSIADIACFPWVITHKAQGLDLADYPNVRRWFTEIRNRPQVQAGLSVGGGVQSLKAPDEEARRHLFGPDRFRNTPGRQP